MKTKMELTERLSQKLFGKKPGFSMVITTTKADNGKYESSVEVDKENPIVNALEEGYIDRVKRIHIGHLQKFPKSDYIRTRIGRVRNERKVH